MTARDFACEVGTVGVPRDVRWTDLSPEKHRAPVGPSVVFPA